MNKRRAIQIITKAADLYKENKYTVIEKTDKSLNIKECVFSEDIEEILERDKME